MLEGILVGIIDASLLRKAMQSCSGVDRRRCILDTEDMSSCALGCVDEISTDDVFAIPLGNRGSVNPTPLGGWMGALAV